jgi:alpha-L-rhamnosidase
MKRLLIIISLFFSIKNVQAQLQVTNLRCEYSVNPLGVETATPHFNWQLQSTQKNVLQTAYKILVSDDSLQLKKSVGAIWNSNKIQSAASIQINYTGKPLQTAKKYFWKVQVWDNKGNVAESAVAYWQMGLLNKTDWSNAKWIGFDEPVDSLKIFPHVHQNGKKGWGKRLNVVPMIRKEFTVTKKIKAAAAFICGLGHFELFINGNKIGDHFLDPGWTNYDKQAQYISFDVTNNLQEGNNAFGVMLGNGFYYIPGQRYRKMTGAYGHPKLILKTQIEYTDGTTENIISDESWQTAPSPIIYSSIFGGEDYDANKEQPGWNKPGFNATAWRNVIITNGSPQLQSQLQQPVKIMQRFTAKTKMELMKNVWVYDLGQNFSGIPAIKVNGNKYDTVRIFCGELLNADGSINQKATGSPAYFNYILKGETEENWQPQFTYTGFRYMQVHCIAKDSLQMPPVVKNIEGLHISNDMPAVGEFTCSNELFNKTNILIDWAVKSNTVSLFTDCPHREKLGWLEQTHLMGTSIQYNYDIATLNRKVVNDMMQSQYSNGKIPEIAPEFTVFTPPFDESPEWGSASIILPWYNYKWYGDKQTLMEAYPMMQRYIDYLLTKDSVYILKHGLGDWFDIGPKKSGFAQMTKMGITATAMLYYDATILTDISKLLNKPTDIKKYTLLAANIKKAFNATFFNKQTMQYDSASQTANAMALYMGLVQPQNKTAVIHALINDIKKRNNALTGGDIGYRYVLQALQNAGRSDVIFDMNSRDDVPGYGYQLKHGATALTESWQAYESVSNNHLMLGHLQEWFYAGLAGIQQTNNSVAYKNIVIKPQPVGDITATKAAFNSPYGQIVSDWKIVKGMFVLHVTIPANTTANIYLPGSNKIIKTGSGNYQYKIKMK